MNRVQVSVYRDRPIGFDRDDGKFHCLVAGLCAGGNAYAHNLASNDFTAIKVKIDEILNDEASKDLFLKKVRIRSKNAPYTIYTIEEFSENELIVSNSFGIRKTLSTRSTALRHFIIYDEKDRDIFVKLTGLNAELKKIGNDISNLISSLKGETLDRYLDRKGITKLW